MRMLKVLYLRSSFNPGGTETLLLNLFNYPQNIIQFHYAFLKDGILISRLQSGTNKYYKVFRKVKIDFSVLRKIIRIIRSENIHIVHTHQMFELFYAVLLKIRYPNLQLFHTIHGYFENKNKWASAIEKFLIRFTKQTFTVSKATRDILAEKGYPVKRIDILYNAINPPLKAAKNEIILFKRKINYTSSDFITGMIGSFVWQKDQFTIIKAFKLVKDLFPELKILFIGKESELSDKCKKLLDKEDIDNRVYFLGDIENAAKYLPVFDLFIMSTLMDTFGIVVIEALMQKVPVLASDIEVMKELSQEGKYFELFKNQNPESLAEEIKNMYKKKNYLIINKAYEYSNNTFSYKRYIEKLLSFYTNV